MTELFEVSSAQPDELPAAFTLALQYVPDDERPTRVANALALLHAGEINPAGVFVARTAAGLVGVQVCIPLRGSSALFWLPQVDPAWCNDQICYHLVQAALLWAQQRGAKLAQALLHPSDLPEAGALTRSGFRHITDLLYLSHDMQVLPPLIALDGLRCESFGAAVEPTFQQTLLRTYDGALDCPELNGVRTIEEILDGHRAQGIWRPQTWWLATLDGAPAGVVMLTELPDGDGWDLSYVGVTPEFRRRGLGRALAIHALHAASQWHAAQLSVAVDERNTPAQSLYQSLGFRVTGRRSVMLLVF